MKIRTFALVALLFPAACGGLVVPDDPRAARDGDRLLEDHGPVGSLGHALLGPAFEEVEVEIDTSGGAEISGQARAGIRDALSQHGRKRSISFSGSTDIASRQTYTTAELRRLAAAARKARSSAGVVSIHVLVLRGRHEDPSTLGISFDATSFAIFPDRLRDSLFASLNYGNYEEALALHELGHLFGLVDLTGRGSFHEDPAHQGHSRNQESVMYWAVEDTSIATVFRGGPPREFDNDDVREMELIRAGSG